MKLKIRTRTGNNFRSSEYHELITQRLGFQITKQAWCNMVILFDK